MTPKLNVMIVGCGNIAGGYDADRPNNGRPLTHAGAFVAHGGFRLLTCVDPDNGKRLKFKSRWDVEESLPSLQDVVGRTGDHDVISICSPTSSHTMDIRAAISLKPKLIFCEKPISSSLAESTDILAECTAENIVLAVNYTRRWAPDIVRLRSELLAATWGEVRSISANYSKGILNNGSHMIDLVNYLVGPCEAVYAGPPEFDFWEDDPTIPAVLRTQDGLSVMINTSDARDYSQFELHITTARGVISMEGGGMTWRVRHTVDSPYFNGYKTLDDGQSRSGEYEMAMLAAATNIHDVITAGATPVSSGATALSAQKLCHDIRKMASGRAEGMTP